VHGNAHRYSSMDEIECVTAAASMRAGERTCEPAHSGLVRPKGIIG
jgi:hypothetical protein